MLSENSLNMVQIVYRLFTFTLDDITMFWQN